MIGAISAGLTAGFGIAKGIAGMSQERKYRKMIENYDRQDLTNVADGMQVSTRGSDLQRVEAARMGATSIDALRRGGTNALGNIGKIQMANNQMQTGIAMDLDRQQQQIDRLRAEDQARIRGMQEAREESDLLGMGAMQQAGKQDMWSGLETVGKAGMYADSQGMFDKKPAV